MSRLIVALVKARSGPVGVALALVLACVVLARPWLEARLSPGARRALGVLLLAALAGAVGLAAADVYSNVRHPRTWDFPSFYVVAHAAAEGKTFYDPAVLTAVQDGLTRTQGVPGGWLSEVGYWYLPPSVFLILPLGFLSFRRALLVHAAVQGLLLLGSAWLLGRARAPGRGARATADALLLLLLFYPVLSTIGFAQIVFGCLFFLLLAEALRERHPIAAGVALSVGFYYKHLLLVPAAMFAVGRDRKDRVLGLSAIAAIVLELGASIVALGPHVAGAYFANGPGARSPQLAVDPVVQSLLALLYRALGATPHGSLVHIVLYPPFLAGAAVLALVTLALQWRSAGDPGAARARFALVTALALLCYPNTLISTLALLAPAALVAYDGAREARWPPAAALAGFAVVWGLPGALLVQAGWVALLVWAALAAQLAFRPRAAV